MISRISSSSISSEIYSCIARKHLATATNRRLATTIATYNRPLYHNITNSTTTTTYLQFSRTYVSGSSQNPIPENQSHDDLIQLKHDPSLHSNSSSTTKQSTINSSITNDNNVNNNNNENNDDSSIRLEVILNEQQASSEQNELNQQQHQPNIPRVTPVTNKAHFSEPPPPIEGDADLLFSSIKSSISKSSNESTLDLSSLKSKTSSSAYSSSSSSTLFSSKKLEFKDYDQYLERNIRSYQHISSFSDLPLEFGYNQHISIDNKLQEQLRAILWKFNAPIKYAFAYGSGVFSQGKSSDATKPQVDLIFGVSYTEHWHSLNMRQNPHHYSTLRYLGSGAVSFVQDQLGSGVYFNPYVEIDGIKIKYGVVNINTLLSDLTNWNSLYLAGRLHKPVKILRDEPRIRFVNQANLISALRTALLTLPEEFTELDLYTTLAGISYLGDPRMAFGENPNKVRNIVHNQFLNFRDLYSPLLDVLPNVELRSSADFTLPKTDIGVATMKQDMDPVRRGNMVVRLPYDFREKLYRQYQSKYQRVESEFSNNENSYHDDNFHLRNGTSFDQSIAADSRLSNNVSRAIRSTVSWPSFTQSCKGVLTAGVGRSIKYALEKLSKARSKST